MKQRNRLIFTFSKERESCQGGRKQLLRVITRIFDGEDETRGITVSGRQSRKTKPIFLKANLRQPHHPPNPPHPPSSKHSKHWFTHLKKLWLWMNYLHQSQSCSKWASGVQPAGSWRGYTAGLVSLGRNHSLLLFCILNRWFACKACWEFQTMVFCDFKGQIHPCRLSDIFSLWS